jgi:hypothetical protein
LTSNGLNTSGIVAEVFNTTDRINLSEYSHLVSKDLDMRRTPEASHVQTRSMSYN